MLLNNLISFNIRPDHWIKEIHIELASLDRVAQIALPFLFFYRPTAVAATVGLATVQSYSILTRIGNFAREEKWEELLLQMGQLTLLTASVATSIFIPSLYSIIGSSIQGGKNSMKQSMLCCTRNGKRAVFRL